MSEWSTGYRQALRDLTYLAKQRGVLSISIQVLVQDMERDAYVIGHEHDNKHAKRKHSAAREAMPEAPLFEPLPLPEAPTPRITRPTR